MIECLYRGVFSEYAALSSKGTIVGTINQHFHTASFAVFKEVFFPRFCWGFLGLAFVRLWLQYHIYDLYFSVDLDELSIASKLFRGVIILMLTVILYHTSLSAKFEVAWRWLSFGLMTLAGIFFFIHVHAFPSNSLFGPIGAYLGALGVIWGGGMWIMLFSRMPVGEAFLYIIANLGLGSLLGFFFGFLPDPAVRIVVLFIPVVIFLSYQQAMRVVTSRNDVVEIGVQQDTIYDSEPKRSFVILLCGMALFVFTIGIAQGFPSGDNISFSPLLQAAHQLSIVIITGALIFWVLIRGHGINFRFIWIFVTGLGICSLICYGAASIIPSVYGATFAIIPITLWLGGMFLLADDISRHTSLPPYIVLGIMYGIYMTTHFLGRLTSMFFGAVIEQSLVVISLMVFLLALSIVLVLSTPLPKIRPFFTELASVRQYKTASFMPYEQRIESSESIFRKGNVQSDEDRSVLLVLAERYGLTEREVQIAYLIAKGRTRKYIGDTLFLSENTVRNHTRNIYQKLRVHSKQEFLDILAQTDTYAAITRVASDRKPPESMRHR